MYGLVLCSLGVMFFYILAISVSRANGDADVAIDRIFRYFGEPFLNLGLVYWNSTDVHTYGLRFFPKLIEWVGGLELPDSKYGADALRDFWTRVYGVNMYYFKTFFGDLYMEFGVIGAFIASAVIVAGGKFAQKVKNPFICHFVLYYYARSVVLWGIFGFGAIQSTWVDLVYAIVFWWILSKIWNPIKAQDEEEEQ